MAVFLKDQQFAERYPTRILHNKYDYLNGIAFFEPARFHNQSTLTEDRLKLQAAGQGFAEE